jgi:hypothetical protein
MGQGRVRRSRFNTRDSLGALDMRTAWVWFNTTFAQSAANSCMVYYDRMVQHAVSFGRCE